jgi:hypothetical protein
MCVTKFLSANIEKSNGESRVLLAFFLNEIKLFYLGIFRYKIW